MSRRLWIPLLGVLALVLALRAVGCHLERFLNRVDPVVLPAVSAQARALHASVPVVDMHADSLLMGRDLLERSTIGHVDVPRLREGGVALQFFTAVTVVHLGTDPERTDPDDFDLVTLAGLAQWSPAAWRSPSERALMQAARLARAVSRSQGGLRLVRSGAELEALLEARRRNPEVVGALLGLEGAHALRGSEPPLAVLEQLHAAGFRMLGLAHFFDNDVAGSAHGLEKGGLTPLGERVVDRMQALGMLVDLAHASPRAVAAALDRLRVPAVVSHGGVQATCPGPRNLSDDQIRRIAEGGGVIGIGYFELAVCGRDLAHIVAAMRHVVELVGDEHVALGSDFDGAITAGFDTSQLPALTQALLDAGLSERSTRRILGENVLRVLREVLPER